MANTFIQNKTVETEMVMVLLTHYRGVCLYPLTSSFFCSFCVFLSDEHRSSLPSPYSEDHHSSCDSDPPYLKPIQTWRDEPEGVSPWTWWSFLALWQARKSPPLMSNSPSPCHWSCPSLPGILDSPPATSSDYETLRGRDVPVPSALCPSYLWTGNGDSGGNG